MDASLNYSRLQVGEELHQWNLGIFQDCAEIPGGQSLLNPALSVCCGCRPLNSVESDSSFA